MRLASFTIVFNERPILGPFLDQLQALFDVSVVVDHGSSDGSAEFVRSRLKNGQLWHLRATGYPQGIVATAALPTLFNQLDADYVFFLDADEFLPFASHADLQHAIEQAGRPEFIELCWQNLVPSRFDGQLDFKRMRMGPKTSVPKVALGRSAFQRQPAVSISMGFHLLRNCDATSRRLSPEVLYHLPVASRRRITHKALAWNEYYLRNPQVDPSGLSAGWGSIVDQLDDGLLDDHALEIQAAGYGIAQGSDHVEPADFAFPYVLSPYEADTEIPPPVNDSLDADTDEFVVLDDQSNVILQPAGLEADDIARILKSHDDRRANAAPTSLIEVRRAYRRLLNRHRQQHAGELNRLNSQIDELRANIARLNRGVAWAVALRCRKIVFDLFGRLGQRRGGAWDSATRRR